MDKPLSRRLTFRPRRGQKKTKRQMLKGQALNLATQIDVAVARFAQPRIRVLINGFWRSGTTWVQESMAHAVHAKTIFEPLSAEEDTAREVFNQLGITEYVLQQASIPGPDLIFHPTTLAHLDASFYGKRWSRLQRFCRRSVLESARRQIIVKGVRFHFNLSRLARRYHVPIVHIRRHPCAVIASLSKVKWNWTFADVKLSRLFEASLGGVTDKVWHRADIAMRRFDDDVISRLAAYWAIVEWIAQQEVAQTESAKIAWYEDLLDDPQRSIRDLCSSCGLVASRSFDPERNSVVTYAGSRAINPATRRHAWRSQMADEDIDTIVHVVEEISPELNCDVRKHCFTF